MTGLYGGRDGRNTSQIHQIPIISEGADVRHPFPIRDIARQSGLSEATVDRVLNDRGGVRPATERSVRQAISDLERQETQLLLTGRSFTVDVVMQAPQRFTSAVRAALEDVMPGLLPAAFRARFHLHEDDPVEVLVRDLDRIARQGSQAVILKAPDVPDVTAAVARVIAAGIPVLTLVTDLPSSDRLAYIGMDNRAAGATAAYLLQQWLGDRRGSLLVTVSSGSFRGEEEREMGFRAQVRAGRTPRPIVEVSESSGLDSRVRDLVGAAVAEHPNIVGVYSIGGGNIALLDAFRDAGLSQPVVIAHDLDDDNRALLQDRRVAAVLHHDLRADMQQACHLVMQAHGAVPGAPRAVPSQVQIVTPYNVPE